MCQADVCAKGVKGVYDDLAQSRRAGEVVVGPTEYDMVDGLELCGKEGEGERGVARRVGCASEGVQVQEGDPGVVDFISFRVGGP